MIVVRAWKGSPGGAVKSPSLDILIEQSAEIHLSE